MSRVIGITGGIATGKSTVLHMFAELGAEVLSADDLAREAIGKGGPAYAAVVKRFGQDIVAENGEIDRPRLAGIIFASAEARRDLNDLTHPYIISSIRERISRFRADPLSSSAILAVEIPLLFECGLDALVDEVIVVAAEPETQESRLTTRRGSSVDQAQSRIAAQMPMEQKIERADRVIWNNGSMESLEQSVRGVWDEIRLL